ncbi:MAG: Hsp20/alpha crystallin family protein [Thermoguttaceae bacterium]
MAFGYRSTRTPLNQLRDEMDRLLTGFLGPAEGILPGMFRNQPAANVWEREDALVVEMEIPGVKNDQLDLSVTGDELSIRIQRQEEAEEGVTFHRRERPVGNLNRVIHLPCDVDADRVEAQIRDGVLTITLPKAESAKPRKINVAAG